MSSKRFSVNNRQTLISEERMKLQPAEGIISRMKLSRDDIVADLGCGIGYVTIPLSKEVKHVMALDGQQMMLDDLIARIPEDLRGRITPVLSELPELPFEESSLDKAVMVNVAHEIQNTERMVSEIIRCLKEDGVLTIVDFNKVPLPFGPPFEEKIPLEDMVRLYSPMELTQKNVFDIYYQIDLKNNKNLKK